MQRCAGLALLPLVTRQLTPEEYGAVAVLAATALAMGAVLGAPIEPLVLKHAATEPAPSSSVILMRSAEVWSKYWCPAFGALAAALVFLTKIGPLHISWHLWLMQCLAVTAGVGLSSYVLPLLRATGQIRWYVALTVLTTVVSVALKLVLVVHLALGPVGWVLSDLVTSATGWIAMHLLSESQARVRLSWTKLALFALPLIPHTVAFWAIGFAARPLIALTSGLGEAAVYSLAYTPAAFIIILLNEVNKTLLPQFSFRTADQAALIGHLYRLLLAWAGGLILITNALAVPYQEFLLPSEYPNVLLVVSVLSAAAGVWVLYAVQMNVYLMNVDVPNKAWWASSAGLVVTVVVTVLLAPYVGAVGAAIANGLAYVAMATVATARNAFSLPEKTSSFRPSLIFVLSQVTLWVLPPAGLLIIGLNEGYYALVLVALAASLGVIIQEHRKPRRF